MDYRLWWRPSCDRAIFVDENVVVKDDRMMTSFIKRDRAGNRAVALIAEESVGFSHIVYCLLAVLFEFRHTDTCQVIRIVTL